MWWQSCCAKQWPNNQEKFWVTQVSCSQRSGQEEPGDRTKNCSIDEDSNVYFSYLCRWVQQTLGWTWCQRDPVSWWPHSHFPCLPKCPSGLPLPSPGLCTPWRCEHLKNKGQRSQLMIITPCSPPFHTTFFLPKSGETQLKWNFKLLLGIILCYTNTNG